MGRGRTPSAFPGAVAAGGTREGGRARGRRLPERGGGVARARPKHGLTRRSRRRNLPRRVRGRVPGRVPGLSETNCARPPGREAGRGRGDRGAAGRSVKTFRLAPGASPGSASASGGVFPAVLGVVRVLASSPWVTAGRGRSARAGGHLGRVKRGDPPPKRRDRRGRHSPGGREGVEASGRPATSGAGAWTHSPLPAGVLWASSVRGVRLLWKWPSEIASSHISAATFPGPTCVRKRDRGWSGDSRESSPGPWNSLPDSGGKSDPIRDFRKFHLQKTTKSRRPA